MARDSQQTLCPSAQPDWADAKAFAVVLGSVASPMAAYLDQALPVTTGLTAMSGPVHPAEIFRFASACAERACEHFDGTRASCSLVRKVVQLAPAVVTDLPRCAIRPDCRWWHQEGVAACLRCPQVVTLNVKPSLALLRAADPHVPVSSTVRSDT